MDTTGLFFAILASITWGLVYTLDQKILTTVSPLVWLAISSMVISILTLPVIFIYKSEVTAIIHSGRNNLLIMLAAQVSIALATFFIFLSIKYLGATNAAIFEITYPFFVIIFSMMIFGGSVNTYFWLGSFFVFIGSLILMRLA